MGRSRGGLTTKIHALVDAEGRPIRLKLTEGQAHDGRSAADMFETLSAGHILLADRAYDGDALRAEMASRGTWANIRAMPNRVKTFPFSAWVYRQRNAVERFFNKLKHFRAVATRYDKRDDNFLASVQLASIRIWLRTYESVTYGDAGLERCNRADFLRANNITMTAVAWHIYGLYGAGITWHCRFAQWRSAGG